LVTERIEEVAAGITDTPTVGIRNDAFEPPGRDLRRGGVKVSPMATTIPTKQGQSAISAANKVERSVKLSRWIVGAGFCSGELVLGARGCGGWRLMSLHS